ncbi:MAG: hypothetical protein EA427_00065 [Spirochaetaceae bacterium]|nr:MAG: hypothetical protein EA427_00065 [Spirochaetaceae bacterium]
MNAWKDLVSRLTRLVRRDSGPETARRVDPRTIIERIVVRTLEMNLLFMTGRTVPVAARYREYRDLEKEIARYSEGYLINALGESGGRRCALLLPPDMISFLVETILKTHGATVSEEDLALVRCMEWIDGRLSRLLFIEDLHPVEFQRVVNRLTGDRRESVLWHASDSALLSFTFEGFTGYLMIDAAEHRRLLRDLGEEEFRRAVRSLVVTEIVPDAPPAGAVPAAAPAAEEARDIQFSIERSHEFTLGNYFIPETFTSRDRTFRTLYERVIIPLNYREWIDAPVLSRTVDLEVNGKSWRLVYTLVEPGLEELLEAIGPPDSFFRSLLSRAVANLKAIGGELQVGRARYVSEPTMLQPMDLEEPVILTALVHTPGATLRMLVFLPQALITVLCLAILSPRELLFLQHTGRNALISILTLNEVLFHRGFADLLPGPVREQPELSEAGVTIPFHDLVELFGEPDLKVITQNFLLPRFGERCVRLFNIQTPFVAYGEADETGMREKVITYRPVLHRNYGRIAPFLPDSFRREEEIVLRNYAGISEFERMNYAVMTDLHKAIAEDRLVVSPRVRYVMRVLFRDAHEAAAEEAIRDCARRGVPFGVLAELEKTRGRIAGQQVLSRCDNRTLGLACLGTGYPPEYLRHLMSRGRWDSFLSDCRFLTIERDAGKIGVGEILQCVRQVHRAILAED